MPLYVERPTGYDLALAGPYQSRGVSVRAYAFEADWLALKATCDRYLNRPDRPDVYLPLGGLALLTMLNIDRVTAGDPALGYMHEIDCAFQFPVLRFVGGWPIPVEVGTFMPYLWVDSHWPVITGREVLGFRKEMGTSFTNADDSQAASAADLQHVDCWVVPRRGNKLAVKRIVAVDPASLAQQTTNPWQDAAAALGEVITALSPLAPLGSGFLGSILSGLTLKAPAVFLKQFRDETDPTLACYQRVVLADCAIPAASVGGGMLPGKPEITLESFDSHPVALELGLGNMAIGSQQLKSEFAFEARLDFDVHLSR
jgi:hypothetical protein